MRIATLFEVAIVHYRFSDDMVWLKDTQRKVGLVTYSMVFRSTFPVMLMP